MTTKELEQLLEGGIETPRIEYKGPCSWKVNTFAKDILALANYEDGGWIIVGMEKNENGYNRSGVTQEQKRSFNFDIMRDQFSKFPESHVEFSVHYPTDRNSIQFVVIRVNEFREIPVLCVKSSQPAGTIAPAIYYRNSDKKIESGLISNYHDLRNLLERAAVKIRTRWGELGLKVPESFKDQLDKELKEIK